MSLSSPSGPNAPRRLSVGRLRLPLALTAALVAGMVAESRLKLFSGLWDGGKQPADNPVVVHPAPQSPATESKKPTETGPALELLALDQFPESVRPTRQFIENHPRLKEWYATFTVEFRRSLERIPQQAEEIDNVDAFGVGRESPRPQFPRRAMEERRAEYAAYVRALSRDHEKYVLALFTVAGIQENKDIVDRLLTAQAPQLEVIHDLRVGDAFGFGSSRVGGLATADRDRSKESTHGVSRDGRPMLKMDTSSTYPRKNFIGVSLHEYAHGLVQNNAQVKKQRQPDFAFGPAEMLPKPFHAYRAHEFVHNERIFEGITDTLSQRAQALIDPDHSYIAYPNEIAIACLLAACDEKTLMSWYAGRMNNEQVYRGLSNALMNRGVSDTAAMRLLNMAFDDGGSGLAQPNFAITAHTLALTLQRSTKTAMPELTKSLNLPPQLQELMAGYSCGSLATADTAELRRLAASSKPIVVQIGDAKQVVPTAVIGTYLFMQPDGEKDALALSAMSLSQDPHHARRTLEKAIKLEPTQAIHHIRFGNTFSAALQPGFSTSPSAQDAAKKQRAYDAALAADPKSHEAHFEVGIFKIIDGIETKDEKKIRAGMELLKFAAKDAAQLGNLHKHVFSLIPPEKETSGREWGWLLEKQHPDLVEDMLDVLDLFSERKQKEKK